MAKDNSTVKEKLAKALAGDESAAAYFHLGGDRDVAVNVKNPLTWETLNKDYHFFAMQWRAARGLGLELLEKGAKKGLINLGRIASEVFEKEVTPEAVFVSERETLLFMKVLVKEMSPQFQTEEGSESEKSDLVQVTSGEDDASDSSDAKPPTKKVKQSPSKSSSKNTHHKSAKCRLPNCQYFGGNLKRHLQTHVKTGEIRKSDIPRLSSVMSQGKKQRGPRKLDRARKTTVPGRRKKWCPYESCKKVYTYLSTHLRRSHGLKKDSVELKTKLKEAREYTGLGEMDLDRSASSSEENESTEENSQTPASPNSKAELPADSQSDQEEEEGSQSATNSEPPNNSSSSDAENDSSSSEDPVAPSSKAFFEARKFNNDRHRWLCGFYQYLALPDAGFKKQHTRLQHCRQVSILMEHLDPNGTDINCLGDEKGDAAWKRWVQPTLEKTSKAPGTIISYLTSLEKFLTYITSEKYDTQLMPPLHPSYKQAFVDLIPALKGWRSTVDSATQAQQLQRHLDEADNILTPEDVQKLRQSRPYTQGTKLIKQAGTGKQLSIREFAEARDVLLVRFSLATGTRPGPLNNATLADYHSARTDEDKKIILVAKHKRSKDGPAILGMDEEMQKLMRIYVTKIRPRVAVRDEEKLFVKDDGHGFPEGTIGKRLSSFWEKSGVRTDKRMSHTDYRKCVATNTHKKAPGQSEAVQKVLGHSKESFERSYVRQQATLTGSKGMDIIANVTSVAASSELKEEKQKQKKKEQKKEAPLTVTEVQAGEKEITKVTHSTAKNSNAADDQSSDKGEELNVPSQETVPAYPPSEVNVPAEAASNPPSEQNVPAEAASNPPSEQNVPAEEASNPQSKEYLPAEAVKQRTQAAMKDPKAADDDDDDDEQIPPTPSKADALSEKQKTAIKELFDNEIRNRQPLEIKKIRIKLFTRTVLRPLATMKNRAKQVQNYLNNLIRTLPAQTLPIQRASADEDKVQNWLDTCPDVDDTSSTTKSGRRQCWDAKDGQIVAKHFARFSSLPTKDTIRKTFQQHDDLNRIMQEEGFKRCYEKVKTIFKKKR